MLEVKVIEVNDLCYFTTFNQVVHVGSYFHYTCIYKGKIIFEIMDDLGSKVKVTDVNYLHYFLIFFLRV